MIKLFLSFFFVSPDFTILSHFLSFFQNWSRLEVESAITLSLSRRPLLIHQWNLFKETLLSDRKFRIPSHLELFHSFISFQLDFSSHELNIKGWYIPLIIVHNIDIFDIQVYTGCMEIWIPLRDNKIVFTFTVISIFLIVLWYERVKRKCFLCAFNDNNPLR